MLKKLLVRLFLSHPEQKVVASQSPTTQDLRFNAWFADNGDKTHRLNYNLDEESIVLDLGGYRGDWAADIFCKYSCNMQIFEPIRKHCDLIVWRFSNNPKVRVSPFGLANREKKVWMALNGSSTSAFKDAPEKEEVLLKEAAAFFRDIGLKHIDLMKINIEGGEYDLLDHLLDVGLVPAIKNLQIQFHDFVPDAESRMRSIQSRLAKTHELTYQYEFVWENWKLKNMEAPQ